MTAWLANFNAGWCRFPHVEQPRILLSHVREAPQLSVVIATHNRSARLATALRGVLTQRARGPTFELIIVDNNSSDETRAMTEAIAGIDSRVCYLFEPQQGVSHARNAGIAAARAPIVAFTDDDVCVSPDWTTAIWHAFQANPWADFAGGRVLPRWPRARPRWLTPRLWSPLALVDYGSAPVRVDLENPICLVTCNAAFRRATLERVGGFDPRFQHREGAYSACEDQELELRILRAGGAGLYVPDMIVEGEVQRARLSRSYHRRWHFDHGRAAAHLLGPRETFNARGLPVPVQPGAPMVFGAAPWVFREIASKAWAVVRALARGRTGEAFANECEGLETLGHLVGCYERRRLALRGTPSPAVLAGPPAVTAARLAQSRPPSRPAGVSRREAGGAQVPHATGVRETSAAPHDARAPR